MLALDVTRSSCNVSGGPCLVATQPNHGRLLRALHKSARRSALVVLFWLLRICTFQNLGTNSCGEGTYHAYTCIHSVCVYHASRQPSLLIYRQLNSDTWASVAPRPPCVVGSVLIRSTARSLEFVLQKFLSLVYSHSLWRCAFLSVYPAQ